MAATKSNYTNYEEHFHEREKILCVNPQNQPFVNSYLAEVKKRSDCAYQNQKSALKDFFAYIDKSVKKITMIDVKDYFDKILDKKTIKVDSKNAKRSYLSSFFNYVKALLLDEKKLFVNPVPDAKIYQFTSFQQDVKKSSQKSLETLTKEQMAAILDYGKKNLKKKHFIALALLICTGARPSEIVSIKLADIEVSERYFETGFEKNARKTTLKSKDSLIFFFTQKFLVYFENYVMPMREQKKKWLFSTSKDENHLHPFALFNFKRKIEKGLGFKFNLRMFRKTIITEYTKNKCPDGYREGLMNHKGNSVEWQHYIKLTIPERRSIFDEYFPYRDFPYF